MADEGAAQELSALRQHLGAESRIACDLHWTLSPDEAVQLARKMAPDQPWFLEAPIAQEDIEGLRRVPEESEQSIAVGEE